MAFFGILFTFFGLMYLVAIILKEEVFTKQVPPGTDFRQAFIDSNTKGIRGKELDRRLTNGYYVKKK